MADLPIRLSTLPPLPKDSANSTATAPAQKGNPKEEFSTIEEMQARDRSTMSKIPGVRDMVMKDVLLGKLAAIDAATASSPALLQSHAAPDPPCTTANPPAGGRGTVRAAQQTAREQIRETAKDEHIAAVHKAKENVQALKREARKYGYRLARAKAQLEKLRPKVDQLHAHVNGWLEASTTASGELVQEDRPPFDQDGFPIPNQQWRSAADAHKASIKGAKEYHYVDGGRIPLIEAKSMRARDLRKLQQEKFAHKDKRSRRSEVAESSIPTPGISLSPMADAAELADGLRKRKREDENEDPESGAKRMRTMAHE